MSVTLLEEIGRELNCDDTFFDNLEKFKYILIWDYNLKEASISPEDVAGYLITDDVQIEDEIINPWNEKSRLIVTDIDRVNQICYVALWE